MEAISKRTGRKITGKIAEILVRKGSATPCDGSCLPPKKVAKVPKQKATKK